MTNTTPPDWVLIEAAKRCGWTYGTADNYHDNPVYAALCDMILKHEQPPIDRKLLCAREALREVCVNDWPETACVRAIELYESGFGK